MVALGRGLGSLIPQKVNKQSGDQVTPAVSVINDTDKIWHLDPKVIAANDQQPRQDFDESGLEELAQSIKLYGILQPLVVSKSGNDYRLITGERRLRAARKINLPTVPVIIREADEQNRLELALIENIQRQDLNPLELAVAYRRLIDEFNLGFDRMAERVSKSRAVISNTIRLLSLPEEIQQALITGRISEGHAKIIVGLPTEAKQFELYHKIVANKMTVAQAAVETQKMGGTKHARIKENRGDQEREAKLREFFGVKASLKRKDRGGQIIIDFTNDEELEEIIKKVS